MVLGLFGKTEIALSFLKKKSIENYNFQSPMCCILLFYNSQPYIVDPYIAAYFGYLMIHNHY